MGFYITGDTHGDIDLNKLSSKNFPIQDMSKDKDFLLILGDVGILWYLNEKKNNYLINWYNKKPWTTLFIDGNHENHAQLDSYKVEEFHGGKVHKISDSIYHLMRGQVFNFNDHTCFTMGGASSHDKLYRIENISWWARQLSSMEEYDEALINLGRFENEVDYIFTHCVGDNILYRYYPYYVDGKDLLTNFLYIVDSSVSYKHWYFGHYHEDRELDSTHTVMYNEIKKLW